MNQQPLVTIGLPVYNSESTVEDTVRSILAQTYEQWELIVVDDGSTDQSVELCARVDDPRIKIHDSSANRGLAYRLNQVTALATGDFIARMDADDFMHPERLEKQVRFLLDNPDVDLVGTGLFSVDTNLRVHRQWRPSPIPPDSRKCTTSAALAHATVMGRARWFRDHSYNDTFRRAEDLELWMRTRHSRKSTSLQENLYFYREVGIFNYAKHKQSAQYERKAFYAYCAESTSKVQRVKYEVQSRIKQMAYLLAEKTGQMDRMVHRRNQAVSADERVAAQRTLDDILCVPLPIKEKMAGKG